ncbi:hypothetical protein F4860DRAFT_512682 [Xylaria cubensis]|nr:hypothetical protein F4860DRAFT_512682 [Xylaria cubensis]
MAPCISKSCTIMCLPYELKSMIFAALSDDPDMIIALAKTCKEFYNVYYDDKKGRFKYAEDLITKAVGCYSRSVLKLGILTVKSTCHRGKKPEFQDFDTYEHKKHWEFTAKDFEIVRSSKFENEIREAYRMAQDHEAEAKIIYGFDNENGAQNAYGSGVDEGASKQPVNISVGHIELEVQQLIICWDNFTALFGPNWPRMRDSLMDRVSDTK